MGMCCSSEVPGGDFGNEVGGGEIGAGAGGGDMILRDGEDGDGDGKRHHSSSISRKRQNQSYSRYHPTGLASGGSSNRATGTPTGSPMMTMNGAHHVGVGGDPRKDSVFESDTVPISNSQIVQYMARLESSGVCVFVVLATGEILEVQLKLNKNATGGGEGGGGGGGSYVLSLARKENKREIPLRSITSILSSGSQLSRVGTVAELDKQCSGILMTTGTCITFRFPTVFECRCFEKAMDAYLISNR